MYYTLRDQQMHNLSTTYTITYELSRHVSASQCHHQGDIRQINVKNHSNSRNVRSAMVFNDNLARVPLMIALRRRNMSR
jgi:hypothetical protein